MKIFSDHFEIVCHLENSGFISLFATLNYPTFQFSLRLKHAGKFSAAILKMVDILKISSSIHLFIRLVVVISVVNRSICNREVVSSSPPPPLAPLPRQSQDENIDSDCPFAKSSEFRNETHFWRPF